MLFNCSLVSVFHSAFSRNNDLFSLEVDFTKIPFPSLEVNGIGVVRFIPLYFKKDYMNTQKNKDYAIAFYRMSYEGNPRKATELYVGSEYIQHNPLVGDGIEPFIKYFERMQSEYPNKSIEFVRAVAEGTLVALHTHQVWPNNEEYVTMDFFRFDEDGKIVEHWDAMQEIPESSAHDNKMY